MKFFKDSIEHFVKYPILANILIILTLIGGVAAFLNTNASFFPTRKDKNITISVVYPGASPEEMEEGVTLKIEQAIRAIPGIEEINSNSSENSCNINILIYDQYDIDDVYTDVKTAVDGLSSFPAGAEKPTVYRQRQESTAQWIAVTGDVDLKTLKYFAEKIEDDLIATGHISQINISGFPNIEISVEVTEETLRRYELTFDQIVAAIRANNRDFSAGSIKTNTEEILIRSNAKETSAEGIGEIILRSNRDGTKLFIRDVAKVSEQFADQPSMGFFNGKRAVFVEVKKLENQDLKLISETVTDYIDKFNASSDEVKMTLSWNFMTILNQRLDLLTKNGIMGLALVFIALGLFLNIRLSFWVAWGIPSSFLGMFILGSFVGLTINMISLFGMILVIGILVDDGIVIAENIFTHFEKHKNPIKAAVNGSLEVLSAVFTSVLTTIVAFSPLLIITGGFEFLKDMAIVVIFSLAFSLLEAFLVLPAHLASKKVLSLKKEDTRSYRIRKSINNFIDFCKVKIYGNMLRFTLKYKMISLAFTLAFAIIIVGLLAGGFIKSTFFPNIPFNSFNIDIAFLPGEREDKVLTYLDRFQKAIDEVNQELKIENNTEKDIIDAVFTSLGRTSSETGSHAGHMSVLYTDIDEYGLTQYDLINRIKDKIGPVPEAEKFSIGARSRFGKPVSVFLEGKNYDELNAAKKMLKEELNKVEELKEIEDDLPIGRNEILFKLNNEAYFLGLNQNEISKQMRQGFFGEEAQRFMKGNDEVKVWVRYPNSGKESIGQIEKVKIKVGDSEYPITQLTDYQVKRGITSIRHFNVSRTITVEAEMVDPYGEVPPVLDKVRSSIVPNILSKYPSVSVEYGGQAKESDKSMKEIGSYFGAAFLLNFFILMITFRSFSQAVLIVGMIPLGWLGAILGHGIEDWISPSKEFPVSILSAWGMIALSGVVINDAVVFMAKYNSLIKDDRMKVTDAVFEAGMARFRPIILTSLTTVAGLYPLIKETSFQAQFLIPMAISVAYGVIIGTFIILLFLPVFILLLNDFNFYMYWLWNGKKAKREDLEPVIEDEKRLKNYIDSV